MSASAEARAAHLPNWAGFAFDARTHARAPEIEPPEAFRRKAENAALWPWPRPGDMRCRALHHVAVLFCQTSSADERKALAPALNALGEAVESALTAVRFEALGALAPTTPPLPAERLPSGRD